MRINTTQRIFGLMSLVCVLFLMMSSAVHAEDAIRETRRSEIASSEELVRGASIDEFSNSPEYVVYTIANDDGTMTVRWWGTWDSKCEPDIVNEEDIGWDGEMKYLYLTARQDNLCLDEEPDGSDWYAHEWTSEVLATGTILNVVLWADIAPPEAEEGEYIILYDHYFTAGVSSYAVKIFLPIMIR